MAIHMSLLVEVPRCKVSIFLSSFTLEMTCGPLKTCLYLHICCKYQLRWNLTAVCWEISYILIDVCEAGTAAMQGTHACLLCLGWITTGLWLVARMYPYFHASLIGLIKINSLVPELIDLSLKLVCTPFYMFDVCLATINLFSHF